MIKVVAEAGQCMEGSIDRAILMAEAAAAAGAWGFKIQALDPDLIVTRDASRYWEHGEARSQHATFTRNGVIGHDQWGPVAEACRSLGLKFIATPFDVGAVDKLDALVDAWKIASGDINNARLLREVASTGLPTIVSTGAASMGDVNTAVSALANVDVTLLACSLEYPTPPEHAQLARIRTLTKAPLACEVGYSDHTLGTWAAPLAVAAGATMLEKHFSLGGDLDVPDHAMALNAYELAKYVQLASAAQTALGAGRLDVHGGEGPALRGARRSWRATRRIRQGDRIGDHNAAPLRPVDYDAVPASIDLTNEGVFSCATINKGDLIRWENLSLPSPGFNVEARSS